MAEEYIIETKKNHGQIESSIHKIEIYKGKAGAAIPIDPNSLNSNLKKHYTQITKANSQFIQKQNNLEKVITTFTLDI